jgi:hypothetical protein
MNISGVNLKDFQVILYFKLGFQAAVNFIFKVSLLDFNFAGAT